MLIGGDCVGYAIARDSGDISELVLADPTAQAKPFFKAWHAAHGNFTLDVPIFDVLLQREAADICEELVLEEEGKLCVIDWETTLSATLALKRLVYPMLDGRWTIQVENDPPLTLEVAGQSTSVKRDSRTVDAHMTHAQAQTALFSRESLLLPNANAPQGWFPLSLGLRGADNF